MQLEALKCKWWQARHSDKLKLLRLISVFCGINGIWWKMSFQRRRLTSLLNTLAAEVRRLTFDGYSPLQWWFGTRCAREGEEHGLGEHRSSFERRLEFQTVSQTAFVRADARKTLRLGQYARSRVLRNPTVGQRRSKGGVGGGRDRGLG